jgi:hypothetical protein
MSAPFVATEFHSDRAYMPFSVWINGSEFYLTPDEMNDLLVELVAIQKLSEPVDVMDGHADYYGRERLHHKPCRCSQCGSENVDPDYGDEGYSPPIFANCNDCGHKPSSWHYTWHGMGKSNEWIRERKDKHEKPFIMPGDPGSYDRIEDYEPKKFYPDHILLGVHLKP